MRLEADASRMPDADLRRLADMWARFYVEHPGTRLGPVLHELAADVYAELDARAATLRALADSLDDHGGVGSLVEPGADPFAAAAEEFRRGSDDDDCHTGGLE